MPDTTDPLAQGTFPRTGCAPYVRLIALLLSSLVGWWFYAACGTTLESQPLPLNIAVGPRETRITLHLIHWKPRRFLHFSNILCTLNQSRTQNEGYGADNENHEPWAVIIYDDGRLGTD